MTEHDSDQDIFEIPPQREGIWIGLFGLAIFFGLVLLGNEGLARVVTFTVVVIIATIRICWPLRRNTWFWILIVAIATLHLISGLSFDWAQEHHGAFVLVPLGILDVVLILCLVAFLNNLRSK